MSREAYASRDFCLSYIFQYLFHISLPAEDYGVIVLIKHVFGGGDSDKLVALFDGKYIEIIFIAYIQLYDAVAAPAADNGYLINSRIVGKLYKIKDV